MENLQIFFLLLLYFEFHPSIPSFLIPQYSWAQGSGSLLEPLAVVKMTPQTSRQLMMGLQFALIHRQFPVTCMFLDCKRKVENLERTQQSREKHVKYTQYGFVPEIQPKNFLL